MAAAPTQQADDPSKWFDDGNIDNEDKLYRVVKAGSHLIVLSDGTFGVSDQLWKSLQGGCSTELESLILNAGQSSAQRMTANNGVGVVEVRVGDVRACHAREGKGVKTGPLGVAYTPIPPSKPHGPNQFHCDIFPKLGNPGSRDLHGRRVVLQLDQTKAKELYDQRHGISKSP